DIRYPAPEGAREPPAEVGHVVDRVDDLRALSDSQQGCDDGVDLYQLLEFGFGASHSGVPREFHETAELNRECAVGLMDIGAPENVGEIVVIVAISGADGSAAGETILDMP